MRQAGFAQFVKKCVVGGLVISASSLWVTQAHALSDPVQSLSMVERVMDEDGLPRAFDLTLHGIDYNKESYVWSISAQGAHGKASVVQNGSAVKVDYQPEPNWHGNDEFTVQLADGRGGASEVLVKVVVEPTNDAPVNKKPPQIIGHAIIGSILTARMGEWDDSIDGEKGDFFYSYQWMRAKDANSTELADMVAIEGATEQTYQVTKADNHLYLAVEVTAHDRSSGESVPLQTSAMSLPDKVGNYAPVIGLAPLKELEETFLVKAFEFVGNKSFTTEELNNALADYTDRELGITKLKEVTAEVTKFYRQKESILASAYLPKQEIGNGTVKIKIVEAEVDQITVAGNKSYNASYLKKIMEKAARNSPLKSDDIERGLLTLNTLPALSARSVLQKGGKPGTASVNVQVEESKPFGVSVEYNNHGSTSVSRERYQTTLSWDNIMGSGAQATAAVLVGETPKDLAYKTLDIQAPVGYYGTKLGVSYSTGNYDVTQVFSDLGIKGESTTGKIYVQHPFVLRRNLSLYGEVGVEGKNAPFYLLGTLNSKDRVRIAYAQVDSTFDLLGGSNTISANVTQGLGAMLGGSPNGTKTSRTGADNQFSRLQLTYAHNRQLHEKYSFYGTGTWQAADDSLVSSEEFQIGGQDSVRGHTSGAESGDNGYRTSFELRYTDPAATVPYMIYSFLDHGYVRRKEPLINQEKSAFLTGYGVGAMLNYTKFGVTGSMNLDMGWPIYPAVNTLKESPVVSLSTSITY
ncbi:Polypeptide-transport-associated domain protein, ShlB-type [Magnetococcus marinus MC-1]|uniref:Polypeptide-transport-associated domain protein, ShlB-type n=1 Tax=Magnetococcus marinus (strain ATCC BAA-1437 / JCM 17883 / MC-1) TaxID=156889 RepID=A0L5Q7_MAGMM|nr:Polypeptide-transport-associated domain protein, ShlB-type [Magnetococcus marinus MC-1]